MQIVYLIGTNGYSLALGWAVSVTTCSWGHVLYDGHVYLCRIWHLPLAAETSLSPHSIPQSTLPNANYNIFSAYQTLYTSERE